MLSGLGKSFLVFISVVGGALASFFIAELRDRFQRKNQEIANKAMEPMH